jgi:ComF family protein
MLRLFLPIRCLNCDTHIDKVSYDPLEKYLCVDCLRRFRVFEPPIADTFFDKIFRFGSLNSKYTLFAPFVFSSSDPLIQTIIHHSKYHSMQKLATLLGIETASRLPAELKTIDHIIPVPLHRTRYSERGFNQSQCIANGITTLLKRTSVLPTHLRRIKPTPSQTGLTAEEREENVRGAFKLSKKAVELKGKRLLLIDDVMTTGSTLASAATELDKAGPASIAVVAVSAVINADSLPTSAGATTTE